MSFRIPPKLDFGVFLEKWIESFQFYDHKFLSIFSITFWELQIRYQLNGFFIVYSLPRSSFTKCLLIMAFVVSEYIEENSLSFYILHKLSYTESKCCFKYHLIKVDQWDCLISPLRRIPVSVCLASFNKQSLSS